MDVIAFLVILVVLAVFVAGPLYRSPGKKDGRRAQMR